MLCLMLASVLAPANLVANPDFDRGAAGFKSDYSKADELSNTGAFAVGADPHKVHGGGYSMPDHTGNKGGNMLIANGAEKSNQAVWIETVSVSPGQNYSFSFWGASWGVTDSTPSNQTLDNSPARLVVYINGKPLGNAQQLVPTDGVWSKQTRAWDSGKATTATIRIIDENLDGFGNDFAIDDISFHKQ